MDLLSGSTCGGLLTTGDFAGKLSDFATVYCFCFELTLDHPVQLFGVLGVTQQL